MASSLHPWKLMSVVNILYRKLGKYCWIVSSCSAAYLTSGRIQVLRSSASVNSRLNPAFFDLIGYFKHFDIDERFWAAALSQNTLN